MKKADYWIKNLDMVSHPEGGYYHVTYASPHRIQADAIDSDFKGSRALASSIYFLIEEGNVSNFHRLKSDEIWYFHEGEPLTIAMIHKDGSYESVRLGLNLENGEKPQIIVPAGTIFGSYPEKGYALVSCMVSYAFEFEDFELFRRKELLDQYPEHEAIILSLTRG